MTYSGLLIQTITITPRSPSNTEDSMGNLELTEGTPFTTPGRIDELSAEEVSSDQDVSRADAVLFLLPGVVIDHHAKVSEGGRNFEVVNPDPVLGAAGVHHPEVLLRRMDS